MKFLSTVTLLLLWIGIYGQSVIASAGSSAKSTSASLDWTIGELFILQRSNDTLQLDHGFHQLFLENLSTSISEYNIDAALDIYPNPTYEFLNVEIKNSNKYRYSVFNAHRKLIESGTIQRQGSIDVSNFPQGTFILELSIPNREYGIYSFIKM